MRHWTRVHWTSMQDKEPRHKIPSFGVGHIMQPEYKDMCVHKTLVLENLL